jgi:uncharacterized RDD family membrane protein YckC
MSPPDVESREHEGHRDITIENLSTPPIHLTPAPLTKRFAAGLTDSALLTVVWALVPTLSGTSLKVVPKGAIYEAALYLAALTFLYYFLLEWILAASIGKLLFRLRVFGADGEMCSMNAALKRNLLRFVDWPPFLYIVAIVSVVASRDRLRVGDRAASTIVSMAPAKDINPPSAPFLFH